MKTTDYLRYRLLRKRHHRVIAAAQDLLAVIKAVELDVVSNDLGNAIDELEDALAELP